MDNALKAQTRMKNARDRLQAMEGDEAEEILAIVSYTCSQLDLKTF